MIKVMFILRKYTQTSVAVNYVRRLSVLCYITLLYMSKKWLQTSNPCYYMLNHNSAVYQL